jgi:hypothetical protein
MSPLWVAPSLQASKTRDKAGESGIAKGVFGGKYTFPRLQMLITTSKRPGHRSRIFGRELANVFTNSRYLPRGTKTIVRLIELAKKLGQSRVMIINSIAGQPRELRFLEVGEGWRWVNAKILLKEVKLQRELGQRMKLDAIGIYPKGGSEEFARTLGSLTGLPLINELGTSAAVLVESGDKKLIQFWTGESKTGPMLYIEKFEKLYPSEERKAGKPW